MEDNFQPTLPWLEFMENAMLNRAEDERESLRKFPERRIPSLFYREEKCSSEVPKKLRTERMLEIIQEERRKLQTKVLQKGPMSSSESQIEPLQPRKAHPVSVLACQVWDAVEDGDVPPISKSTRYAPHDHGNIWVYRGRGANFHQKKQSSKAAKKEDDEALGKIPEEERKEQLRREVKKRKPSVTYGVGLVQPSTESLRKSSRLRKAPDRYV